MSSVYNKKFIVPIITGASLWVCLLSVLFFSCRGTTKDYHPQYFNPILYRYDSIPNERKKQGIAFLDSALSAFPHPGDGDKIEIYNRKTFYNIEVTKNYEQAFLYADSMLLLSQPRISEENFAIKYANALFKKGDIYFWLNNYDKAIEYYTLGKQIVMTRINNKCILSGYNGRIANLVFKQGHYLSAAHYYVDGYNEESECQSDKFLRFVYCQGNLNNVGTSYLNAGMYDSATYYCNEAMNYIDKNQSYFPDKGIFVKTAKAVIYGTLARIADKTNHFEEAEKLYQKSIEDVMKEDVDYGRATQLELSAMYIKIDSLKKAELILTHIDPVFSHSLIGSGLLKWSRLMADLYSKENKLNLSSQYLQKYVAIKDSLEQNDKKFSAIDVGKEFENREQKAMNQLLKKENELKSVYLFIALIASVMAIAIILLVWQNLRKSAKHVKDLETLNRQVQETNRSLQQLNAEMIVRNDDLQTAFTSLEQSHKENTRITRIVAHDLKNPISGIYNLVYSLLKKAQPEALREVLELIQDACTNSMNLIKDLLSERKTVASIKKEKVDMARLLEYCVELLQPKANEKHQQLNVHSQTAYIMLNRQKMWRVISNILNNAIKFSHANTEIDITLEKKNGIVLLSVKDHGIGIPEDIKDKIFSHTPEALRTGTAGEESYGLGLSISRKIIEEHDGKLWFESEDGKGSVFYVALPYAN